MNQKTRPIPFAATDRASRSIPALTAAVLGVGVLAIAGTAHAQTTYVNDSFTDGDRTTQALPSSAAWYIGGAGGAGTPGTGTVSSGTYSVGLGGTSTNPDVGLSVETTTAYFTTSGSPVSLNVGDSITLSFDVSGNYGTGGSNSTSDSFRFGLFNSGGSRLTSDVTTSNGTNAAYTNWTGYSIFNALGSTDGTPTGASPGSERLMKRTGTSQLVESTGASTQLSTTSAPVSENGSNGFSFVSDSYITITRTSSSSNTITGFFGGTAMPTTVDSSTPFTSFDSIVFTGQQGTFGTYGASYTLDNIKVAVTTASAPEPGALALLLPGLLTGGAAILRRRRA